MTKEEAQELEIFTNLAEGVTTENRLLQGIEYLNEMQIDILAPSSIGDFIRWVANDVLKEESDFIIDAGLNPKVLCKQVSKIARNWFNDYIVNIQRNNLPIEIEEELF